MFFELVDFHPAPAFASTDLSVLDDNSSGSDGDKTTTFSSNRYLKPQDVRQYLYRLVPREPSLATKAHAATEVG